METTKILIIGSGGQIGLGLAESLIKKYGINNIILSDIKEEKEIQTFGAKYYTLNAMNKEDIKQIIQQHKITQIYLLAALLSATAEKYPQKGWDLNMQSLLNVLELAVEFSLNKIFWPSSIAVYGHTTPTQNTPNKTIIEPTTVYGISKYSGELWCQYYFDKFGVDVRSIRYPGIISWESLPGGGTTDYAVDIYFKALEDGKYTCYLAPDRTLPMMYMPDAIRATIDLMEAPIENLSTHMAYNISAMSLSPKTISESIKKIIPIFEINYELDYRDSIAQNWPQSIDDSEAKKDWNWKATYDLESMTQNILENLSRKLQVK